MSAPTLPNCKYETTIIPRGGLVIRYARKKRGYNQTVYAEMYGVPRNSLANWESGRTEPSFFTVMSILNDLKVDMVEAYNHVRQFCQNNSGN
jgi:transcriptional regulator with XRE-family HTH domain